MDVLSSASADVKRDTEPGYLERFAWKLQEREIGWEWGICVGDESLVPPSKFLESLLIVETSP